MQPLLFHKNVAKNVPKPVKLLGDDLVFWNGALMLDKCSHRNAKLSQGRVVKGKLECPYHGWCYDKKGACVKIPQLTDGARIPKACNVPAMQTLTHDGVVWAGNGGTLHPAVESFAWIGDPGKYLVTDYELEAPYSFFLQVENLLDPAHIHFVHDGFQGSRHRASPIKATLLTQTDQELTASFVHTHNSDVPEILIRYLIPSVVDVSIMNKNRQVVRKNIVYVSPRDADTCNVLFRDVLFKDFMLPDFTPPFLRSQVDLLLNARYDAINTNIISRIMQQDVDVLRGQQQNAPDYLSAKYVMPSESDLLITLFRRYVRRQGLS